MVFAAQTLVMLSRETAAIAFSAGKKNMAALLSSPGCFAQDTRPIGARAASTAGHGKQSTAVLGIPYRQPEGSGSGETREIGCQLLTTRPEQWCMYVEISTD